MTDLEKYNLVNSCESVQALSDAILQLADENGTIQGRKAAFEASKMANYVPFVVNGIAPANMLTREFGIRQQALYLAYYSK